MTLREIADRLMIQQLPYEYARIPDHRDYDLVDRVFTEDAEFVSTVLSEPVVTGRAAIRREMQAAESFEAMFHAVHNHRVTLGGDEAEGEVYCVSTSIVAKEGHRVKIELGIRYHDRYRRVAGEWQIARRELELVWQHETEL